MERVIAAVLASALVVQLILVQPWLGRARYLRLLAAVRDNPRARLHHYRRGVAGEWIMVGLILVIGALAGRDLASVGLIAGSHVSTATGIVATAAVVLGITAVIFFFGGPRIQQTLQRQARGFGALLPRTTEERLWFVGLAITAGVCEEMIFRGFGFAYLRWLWPAAPDWALVALTAAAFGLAHLYQGARGVVLTGLVGAYFAWTVIVTGSLWPVMAIHALLDLRVLALRNLDTPALPPSSPSEEAPAQRS